MKKKLIEKYCHPAEANQSRKLLSTIKQGPTESMYKYVERFTALEQSYSLFGLQEKMIVITSYMG